MPLLDKYQLDAVAKAHNGCIFNGGVGSGKSRTGLYYYFHRICGGDTEQEKFVPPLHEIPLYIITTPKKRDSQEWELEMIPFLLAYKDYVKVDSWNNIGKYEGVKNAFFIFDEDRVTGYGAWVKSFLKICKLNRFIILSATPGDDWMQYLPVFIANGFYKNKHDFIQKHVVYDPYCPYPKVKKFLDVDILQNHKKEILIDMEYQTPAKRHDIDVNCLYNQELYKKTLKDIWNPYTEAPIENISEMCSVLKKIAFSDEDRLNKLKALVKKNDKVIIFYSFDYELYLIKQHLQDIEYVIAEWNGHKHEPIPDANKWIYLVNYGSGAEGWNCIQTNTIIFYSQTYSWKTLEQCKGRIDRRNTPYKDLYYYHIKSPAPIDIAISKTLKQKKQFNESSYSKHTLGLTADNIKFQASLSNPEKPF